MLRLAASADARNPATFALLRTGIIEISIPNLLAAERREEIRWLNGISSGPPTCSTLAPYGSDHATFTQQGRAIRHYINWRNRNYQEPPSRHSV